METLLEVKDLGVKLDGEEVIENLCFEVAENEVLTILGPNGAGKSVLLKTLLGLLPYQGIIKWSRQPIIGYLPQGLNHLLVKGMPLTVQDFFRLKNQSVSTNEILDFLNLVGLDNEILKQKAGNLSGGQFQRMLLAWVLVSHPEMIFLDEPTTGVDIGGGETIYSLLQDIRQKRGMTIVLVTHDLNIVSGFSTHVLCLSRRGYSCFGKPEKILNTETFAEVFGKDIKFYTHAS